ncbi:bacterial transcriptional activator domain-containing protein [Deinococcus planocerae]|uniref:bacterial transcriptional activator domain-containing protein n=1 Tax=Deinococcus planocerae TaxID=1737569 RepID=UPI000C7EA8C2|nr:bacterial transcriptional activator domain-containing protein [Deinococcus planocerae]
MLPGRHGEWVEDVRTRVIECAAQGAWKRGQGVEADAPKEALAHYRRALRLDPLYEDAHRAVIALYRRLGNEPGAHAALRDFCRAFGGPPGQQADLPSGSGFSVLVRTEFQRLAAERLMRADALPALTSFSGVLLRCRPGFEGTWATACAAARLRVVVLRGGQPSPSAAQYPRRHRTPSHDAIWPAPPIRPAFMKSPFL